MKKIITFASVSGMPYGKTKEEHRAYMGWWRNLNREDYNKKRLEWSRGHKERRKLQARRSFLLKQFGITIEDYEKLLQKHNHQCEICRNKFKKVKDKENRVRQDTCIDHCHKSGKIRGLLCLNCNSALGYFKEDVDILKGAIKYLRKYKEKEVKNE